MGKNVLKVAVAVMCLMTASSVFAIAVDTNGAPVTNATAFGDIDMQETLVGDMGAIFTAGYATTNYVNATTTNLVAAISTNFITRGEAENGFTGWKCNPELYNDAPIVIALSPMGGWVPQDFFGNVIGNRKGVYASTNLTWSASEWEGSGTLTATRCLLRPTALSQLENDTNFIDAQSATNLVNSITNSAFAGYGWPFTVWINDHPEMGITTPVYTNDLWRFTTTNAAGQIVGNAYWIEAAEDAVEMNYTLNSTLVTFTRDGVPIYTNAMGFATISNLSQYVKHKQLEDELGNYVSNQKLQDYDASYKIVEGVSDENQTIQLVINEEENPAPLEILLPKSGRCKDWIVYVVSLKALPLILPPADYWARNESVTNEIAAGTPTALYFSQVSTNNIFTIGRQEYNVITVNATREYKVRETMRKILLSKPKSKTIKRSMR